MCQIRAFFDYFCPFLRNSRFPVREIKAGDDMFFTRAMAEVLEGQGFLEDALMIYNILASTHPGDREIDRRIKALKDFAASGRRGRKGALKKV